MTPPTNPLTHWRRRRHRRPLALHERFARGYWIGLGVGILVGFGVWWSTQSGLDVVAAEQDTADELAAAVDALDHLAFTLDVVASNPSPVNEGQMLEAGRGLVGAWAAVTDRPDTTTDLAATPPAADLPDDLATLVAGDGMGPGADARVRTLVASLDLVTAGLGVDSSLGLDAASVADRLAFEARGLAAELAPVAADHAARADEAIAGMRLTSHLAFAGAVVFLVALVFTLLRPLERQLAAENGELIAANDEHARQAARRRLATQISEGLEDAESEVGVYRVVGRALGRLVSGGGAELLMADSSKAHVRVAVEHPVLGRAGCSVESPWSCPAVRRGRSLVFEDSEAINACPYLVDRVPGGCSAVCVPVAFMGQSLGVVHVRGERGVAADAELVESLGLVASQTAMRVGTLRSFARAELQASTDVLTGLPNRRATEARLAALVSQRESGSVVMADLDRFKMLNDTFGHEAGDRALRMFAEAVRAGLREQDWVGRWGGEEFVLVLPDLSAGEAVAVLERVRASLAEACGRAETPKVTVSMGVVDTSAATDVAELVRLADDALLAAKAQGRDRIVVGPVLDHTDTTTTSDHTDTTDHHVTSDQPPDPTGTR